MSILSLILAKSYPYVIYCINYMCVCVWMCVFWIWNDYHKINLDSTLISSSWKCTSFISFVYAKKIVELLNHGPPNRINHLIPSLTSLHSECRSRPKRFIWIQISDNQVTTKWNNLWGPLASISQQNKHEWILLDTMQHN